MARPASGRAVLEQAKGVLETARSVDELKMAQAVVLPLELGLTLRQTAAVIGVSPGWACRLRRRFERIVQGEESPKPPRGGRRRELLTPEQEAVFLAPYLEEAKAGGVLVVPPIQAALESYLGRPVALSTVYRMLHRQGWRKLAPDKRHPKADPAAQEAWKKNSPRNSQKSSKGSKEPAPSG
ncbi:helix-turn-helix domain-containing protein [Methylocaldum sp.]|uniref:helix-turn-helix domain-containing protein n=1 Tax=Methylocaldum sp. TaxID=1969727 RepID=UPI002D68546E|nr:winged helix-turn-helix domain-containing protein [Methylocaldum sp.]HYE35557.1 winged helix-turn-helix domain-containing protein [Methylocaldum sp.]